jgi:hypothetical protein
LFEVKMLSVEAPEPLRLAGLKLVLAFAGMPLKLKTTVRLDMPAVPTMVAVKVSLSPGSTVRDCGEAEREKSNTFKMLVMLLVRLPLTPVRTRA